MLKGLLGARCIPRSLTVLFLLFYNLITDRGHLPNQNQIPVGGLGIYTDRDQRGIFWVLNFENLCFLAVLVIAAVFFLGSQCCIVKCFMSSRIFLGPILFTRP